MKIDPSPIEQYRATLDNLERRRDSVEKEAGIDVDANRVRARMENEISGFFLYDLPKEDQKLRV